MKDKGYVLLIDILGFTDLVKERSPNKILDIITKFLGCLDGFGSEENFSSIYFSDTAIVWQKNPSKKGKDFLRFTTNSVLMCSTLLANKIPCRGAIAYGDSTVKRDITDKHDIFFGEAFIDAYNAERKENWLGVTVCPSASRRVRTSVIDKHSGGHFLQRSGGTLLLNPFLSIRRAYDSIKAEDENSGLGKVKNVPLKYLALELLAFQFILDRAKEFADSCDFSGRVASKYHTTISFLREVLPDGCFEWAQDMTDFVEMKYGEPRIKDCETKVDNS